MKYRILPIMCSLFLTTAATAACPHCPAAASRVAIQIIPLQDVDSHFMGELMTGKHPNVAIPFPKGAKWPFHVSLSGDLVAATERAAVELEFLQTVYMRCENQELLFSADLQAWKPIWEFTTGSVGFAFNNERGQPQITLNADLSVR